MLQKARRALQSASGKALLRRRGEHLERSFCHVLDHGGCRHATLRGQENLTKRYLGAVLAHNLSVLMRQVHRCGTPKQWVAQGLATLFCLLQALWRVLRSDRVTGLAHEHLFLSKTSAIFQVHRLLFTHLPSS